MLALEKCRVTVGGGSGAHFSVLSGKRHQGRTARRAGEPLTARLLVMDPSPIIARFGPTASIYLHTSRQDYVDTMRGRSHRYLKVLPQL